MTHWIISAKAEKYLKLWEPDAMSSPRFFLPSYSIRSPWKFLMIFKKYSYFHKAIIMQNYILTSLTPQVKYYYGQIESRVNDRVCHTAERSQDKHRLVYIYFAQYNINIHISQYNHAWDRVLKYERSFRLRFSVVKPPLSMLFRSWRPLEVS